MNTTRHPNGIMAADKLKKLEERGRTAFMQGDITAATRFFTQALEKKHKNPDESKQDVHRKGAIRTKAKPTTCVNKDDADSKVWILQSSPRENSRKENEKKADEKCKEDNEIMSGIEILDEIIAEAETSIKSYPNYPLSYLRKASALIILNHWDDARRTYIAGLTRCPEKTILKAALLNLNRVQKITSCAANLDFEKLSDLVNQNGPSPRASFLPSTTSTLKIRHKFRLQSQRRLTKKLFNSEDDEISPQIKATCYRRRNSSSTDTHF